MPESGRGWVRWARVLTVLAGEELDEVRVEGEAERLERVAELGRLDRARPVRVEPGEDFLPLSHVSVQATVAAEVDPSVLAELTVEHLDSLVRERRPVAAK